MATLSPSIKSHAKAAVETIFREKSVGALPPTCGLPRSILIQKNGVSRYPSMRILLFAGS